MEQTLQAKISIPGSFEAKLNIPLDESNIFCTIVIHADSMEKLIENIQLARKLTSKHFPANPESQPVSQQVED